MLDMKYFQLFLVISLVAVFSCSEVEKENQLFREKDPQPVSEHRTKDLALVDSVNLNRMLEEGLSFSTVKYTEGNLIFQSSQNGFRFHMLDTESLDVVNEISIPEGRGPGEVLRIGGYDVKDGLIAILDIGNLKTVLYNLEGEYLSEFVFDGVRPNEIEMIDSETFILKAIRNPDGMFHIVNSEGSVLPSFQKHQVDANLNVFSGEMVYKDGSFYFGGYAEPIIRRYDILDDKVEPVFSRAIIDDYDSSDNYEERGGGEYRVFAFAEHAEFASHDLEVSGDYLYLARHTNGDPNYRFLDVYHIEDGRYEVSFPMQYNPSSVTSDENYLYVLESQPGETIQRHIIKYEKPEMNF
jgi:hypothetical protein